MKATLKAMAILIVLSGLFSCSSGPADDLIYDVRPGEILASGNIVLKAEAEGLTETILDIHLK